jgi:tRNA-dihydrouridine synthase
VNLDAFRYAAGTAKIPLCYNGNLCTRDQITAFQEAFPEINAVMIGRGLIADPGLLTAGGTTAAALECFHNALLEEYIQAFGGSRNAMFRLKENWRHWLCKFENSEKLGKRLRKTTDLEEFRQITGEIFLTLPILEETAADW